MSFNNNNSNTTKRESERFASLADPATLAKHLETLSENEGVLVNGNLHTGSRPSSGDPSVLTYSTLDETDGRVYKVLVEKRGGGEVKETRYYRGVKVSSKIHTSPFTKSTRATYTASSADFPTLTAEEAIRPGGWLSVVTGRAPAAEPAPAADPRSPRPESLPETEEPLVEEAPLDDGFTTVKRKNRHTPKITPMSDSVRERLAEMPANNGMFVNGKIHWGQLPATHHRTFMATELRTMRGKRGVFKFTWGPELYRESFKPQDEPWQTLVNERGVDGRARMAFRMN